MKLKVLTAVAALVASVSASAGELDGKAIVCEPKGVRLKWTPEPEPYGYEFRGGFVISYRVEVSGTQVLLKISDGIPYKEDTTVVTWGTSKHGDAPTTVLDRRTIRYRDSIERTGKIGEEGQCEVLPLDKFHKFFEQRMQKNQAEIDAEMKDNKI